MALIFGRFDKADEGVRDAVITLATAEKDEETGAIDKTKLKGPARVLFDYGLSKQSDATMWDLAHCVGVLAREAKKLGYVGPHCQTHNVKQRWQSLMRKKGGQPTDEENLMTLAEMSVLLDAEQRQVDAR